MVGSMGNANRLHILFYLNKPQCDIYGSTLRNRFLVKLCKLKAHLSILGKKIISELLLCMTVFYS